MEEKRFYTRAEAAEMLHITSWTFQRLCNRYFEELKTLGYKKKVRLVKKECVDFLKEKYQPNILCDISDKLFKNKIASKMGVSEQALSKWLHRGLVYSELKKEGYSKYQKKLTPKQYDIANDELIID